jgi:hypothetical protein
MPNRTEIKLVEILKKIVEAGWIVTEIELKQLLQFAGIKRQDYQGQQNYSFKRFLLDILEELQIKSKLADLIQL